VYSFITAAILLSMALILFRALKGPPGFNRIVAVNSFGTKTVLLIAAIGYLTGRPDFLDIAIVYALMNFIATIALLHFSRAGGLSGADTREPDL
jgi:multicomponent Na+:H+ antiporter subunit F